MFAKKLLSPRLARRAVALLGVIGLAALPGIVGAHCDTMNGPVVMEAKAALETGDITPVLKWIKPDQELELRGGFQHTLSVRKQGDEARELADQYFFETLVRLHRTAEGAPYTGLKNESTEPVVLSADDALANRSADELSEHLVQTVLDGVHSRFEHALETSRHAQESVEKGREYVEAYVEYMHYVERLFNDAETSAAHSEEHEAHSH